MGTAGALVLVAGAEKDGPTDVAAGCGVDTATCGMGIAVRVASGRIVGGDWNTASVTMGPGSRVGLDGGALVDSTSGSRVGSAGAVGMTARVGSGTAVGA